MKTLMAFTLIGCLWFSLLAEAQTTSCCDPMNMPIMSTCGNTLAQGLIRIRSDVKLIRKDKILKDGEEVDNPSKKVDVTGIPTNLVYGVTDWTTLKLILPYLNKEMNAGKTESSNSGIGDITLMSKWRLIRGRPDRPALAGAVGIKFPTGDDENKPTLGSGGYDVICAAFSSKSVGKAAFYGNLIQKFTLENATTEVNPGDVTTINLAAIYRIAERFLLTLEANSNIVGEDKQGDKVVTANGATVYLTPGIKFSPIRPLVMMACVQLPLRQPDGLAVDYIPCFGAMYSF